MTRPDINGRPASEMEEQLLRGGWSSAIARQVTEGHSQCSPNAGGQIAVLLPKEPTAEPTGRPSASQTAAQCGRVGRSRVREDRRGPPNTGVGAVVDQASEWAAFDALLGIEVESAPDATVSALAFYGRCSTEDNQDPETSKAWQLSNAAKFVRPLGGFIAAEFFDIGQSRSVPWERRNAASRLLSELRNRDRGWTGVVVGKARCWLVTSSSPTAPRFEAYGLDLGSRVGRQVREQ